MASPVAISTAVFKRGRHPVDTNTLFACAYLPNLPAIQQCFSLTINQRTVLSAMVFQPSEQAEQVDHSQVPSVPKPLMVVTPTDAGVYPVAVFLHGCSMYNSWYESLLSHVASHGFIAVAPQLGGILPPLNMKDLKDIDATRQVTSWLADKQQGLAHVLTNILHLHGVRPDLSRLALAGHSRGGDTAFAVALGLGSSSDTATATAPASQLKFSALIGVDPVAGLSKELQVKPKVLTFKPRSLDPGMPALVIGTGLGPKHVIVVDPPCAPAGVNHTEFYDECAPPRYHVVVRDYGHLDMLDDDGVPYVIKKCMCKRNTKDTKDHARRAIGGAMVAFLRTTLEDHYEDLRAVLKNSPGLSPAVLDPVEYDLA